MARKVGEFFVRRFFRRENTEEDLQQELEAHLAMELRQRIERGETESEARQAVLREFGNRALVTDVTRDMWGFTRLDELFQDVKYALRRVRQAPGFSVIVVLILALGIGANASIFSLVNAMLLRNLPVSDPRTLVRLGHRNDCCVTEGFPKDGDYSLFSKQTYLDLKKSLPEFEELAAVEAGFLYRPIVVRQGGAKHSARSAMGEFVSGNYFQTLGLKARSGRLLTDADDIVGAPVAAVMSYETWQGEYRSDPAVVGGTFWVNTKPVTIAGISPPGFYGDRLSSSPPEFYLPINSMQRLTEAPYVDDPDARWLYVVGRLKAHAELIKVQAKVNVLLRHSLELTIRSADDKDRQLSKAHVIVTPGGGGIRDMQEEYASRLYLLQWTSALVLLIACANIANLLLVRGMGRKTEMSVRTALGARRGRIVTQLLTESVLLSTMGGAAGLAVAYAGTKLLLAMAFPGSRYLPIDASPSATILTFAIGLSLLTGIVFGVAPAWMTARIEPVQALRSAGRSTAGHTSLLQRCLVILQIALSIVLLVGAGLFGESLNRLRSTDLKVQTKNRYIVHTNVQAAGYTPSQVEKLYRLMEVRFHEIPGIEKVGISSYTPMEDNNNGWGVQIEGRPETHEVASVVKANAEYFDSVGTRVVAGRGIESGDTSARRPIAIVNQSFVHQLFKPGENPIGHNFGFPGPGNWSGFQIVGVVEDSIYTDIRLKDHPMFFVPLGQRPLNTKQPIDTDEFMFIGAIVLQTAGPNSSMESIARQTLAGINPNLAVVQFQTFSNQIADRFTYDMLISRLTLFFGWLALVLASMGLYGVTAHVVARRSSEIGLRIALGATRTDVVAMILRGAVSYTASGLAIGIPVALACVRFVRSTLYGVHGVDAGLLGTTISMLVVAAVLAALIPARRAAGIEPARTLRTE